MRCRILLGCFAIAGCTKAAEAPSPHFGDIMAEVGRRFERLGRAVAAGRWELASYDLGEIEELFADIPTAQIPPDVTIDVKPIAKSFVDVHPGELKRAIAATDRPAFEAAFARAAGTCNGCHQAAKRAFIVVPTTIGTSVPVVDPVAPGH